MSPQTTLQTASVIIPDNITIIPLPAKCPELNPVENIWQFMRDNWLSNRIFESHDEILDHCCDAWNKLIAQPGRIASIGGCKWAQEFRSVQVGITSRWSACKGVSPGSAPPPVN